MLNSLFVNASILIAFLYLGSQLFKNNIIHSKSDLRIKISVGFLYGLCGCILMFNGIDLVNNMIMDFRLIALIISSIYCGPVSTLVTAVSIISFRIGYFGIFSASINASVNLLALAALFSIISISRLSYLKKYILMCSANVLSSVFWTLLTVSDIDIIKKILFNYILSTIIVSFVVYFILIYILKTKEMYLKLKYENMKDYLTGLYNVREFDILLNESIVDTVENNKGLSLLMIDIDFFKMVNDTYGHSAGDMILKQLSDILIKSCRTFDIVSRKGGEEFAVILLDCNYELAVEIAERIRKNVEDYHFTTDKNVKIKITVSIGVSSYPNKTNNINELIGEADKALYFAKHNGKNLVQ